jgi:hypothetical protein
MSLNNFWNLFCIVKELGIPSEYFAKKVRFTEICKIRGELKK